MKSYQYIPGFCLLVAATFSSCQKDFLTLYPEGNLNEGIFYKTTQDFQQALVGAYGPLRDIAANAFWMDEERSDNAHYDYYEKDRGNAAREALADFMDDASNAVTATRYQAAYTGIGRVNAILDHLETNTTVPDSIKKQIIGESKALRGHYYFDLVRNYGGVPLHLHQVLKAADAYLPRSGAEEVYTQVISDLQDALALLPAPSFTAKETGRINKGVVATELAVVYMQRNNFEDALPLLQSVTTMGYNLMTDVANIFSPSMKNADKNKELIFDVQYQSGNNGQQSSFIYRFIPIMPSTEKVLGVKFSNTLGGVECAYG